MEWRRAQSLAAKRTKLAALRRLRLQEVQTLHIRDPELFTCHLLSGHFTTETPSCLPTIYCLDTSHQTPCFLPVGCPHTLHEKNTHLAHLGCGRPLQACEAYLHQPRMFSHYPVNEESGHPRKGQEATIACRHILYMREPKLYCFPEDSLDTILHTHHIINLRVVRASYMTNPIY